MTTIVGPHNTPVGKTDSWLTPPEIIKALGYFDLDPCCPPTMPWPTADAHFYESERDGLKENWFGRIWLNPPYNRNSIGRWMGKLARHGFGTALVFARTDTTWAQEAFREATAVLFLAGRLKFYLPDGTRYPSSAGAPSMLLAYGVTDAIQLETSGLEGRFIALKEY